MEKVVRIVRKNEAGFDAEFWAKKSSSERLAALEHLRNQALTENGIRQRLQRVYRIVKRS